MSPILNQIQEKIYERPIPYSPILEHSGSNRELLRLISGRKTNYIIWYLTII